MLNKRPGIERLYESVCRYAGGKKGIVYAVSIDHAHNIAEYYKEHGINAVAIAFVMMPTATLRSMSMLACKIFLDMASKIRSLFRYISIENNDEGSFAVKDLH